MSQHPFLPVPVKQRRDGWTPDKQWRFVEALAHTASITHAVRAVGMSARSAYRLRDHPDGAAFRAAWDAALDQAWGLIEVTALDRAVNGEREVIEHDGGLVVERRRPCSPQLLMHLLGMRERAQTAARAERVAAHKRAVAEAELARFRAGGAVSGRRRGGKRSPPEALPPAPVLLDDAGAAAVAVAAFRAIAASFETFGSFPEMAHATLPEITAPWVGPDTVIRPRSDAWEMDAYPPTLEASEYDHQRNVPLSQFRYD
jgi:hypothetical protein